MKTDILKLAEETSGMPEDNFFTIEGVKLTDEAVDLLYDLQDDENSNIESLLNGIYEVEEIVLNPEAGASYGERLVMMQTLRDIRICWICLKSVPHPVIDCIRMASDMRQIIYLNTIGNMVKNNNTVFPVLL